MLTNRDDSPELPETVNRVFQSFQPKVKDVLLWARKQIQCVAADPEIGGVEETLKWGNPAYLANSGKGTTVRLEPAGNGWALRVHCQSSVVDRFRVEAGGVFEYDGTRGIVFDSPRRPARGKEEDSFRHFVKLALTYHRWK